MLVAYPMAGLTLSGLGRQAGLQALGWGPVCPVHLHLGTQADRQQPARTCSWVVDSRCSGAHWEPTEPPKAST